jgi:hypothetical protein
MSPLLAFLPLLLAPQHGLKLTKRGDGFRVPYTAALNPQGDLTVEAWIKPRADDASGPFHFIVSKNYGGTGYALLLVGRGDDYRIQFEARDVVAYPIPMRVLSQGWWHVAGVCRGGKSLELYLNGVKVAEKPTGSPMVNNELPLFIGSSPWDSFSGELDDVRIWSVARSQDEIVASAKSRLRGNEPGLMANWDFERMPKGRAYDRTHRTRPGEAVGKPKRTQIAR